MIMNHKWVSRQLASTSLPTVAKGDNFPVAALLVEDLAKSIERLIFALLLAVNDP